MFASSNALNAFNDFGATGGKFLLVRLLPNQVKTEAIFGKVNRNVGENGGNLDNLCETEGFLGVGEEG